MDGPMQYGVVGVLCITKSFVFRVGDTPTVSNYSGTKPPVLRTIAQAVEPDIAGRAPYVWGSVGLVSRWDEERGGEGRLLIFGRSSFP